MQIKKRFKYKKSILLASIYVALSLPTSFASSLSDGFATPPNSAKPLAWWHWMNGNVTKEGIDADLQWMKDIGLGGIQNFDAELMTPLIVDERKVYMTEPWKEVFRHAVKTANGHDLSFAIAASPGWSETGGPWVPAKDGMKKIVWTETIIQGGKPFEGALAKPTDTTGPFQDASAAAEIFVDPNARKIPQYYQDTKVIAYKLNKPVAEIPNPSVSFEGKQVNGEKLFDGSYQETIVIEKNDKHSWLQFDYNQAYTFRSASLAMPPRSQFSPDAFRPTLEASIDGVTYQEIGEFPLGTNPQYSISFPAIEAKSLRIVFNLSDNSGFSLPSSPAPGVVYPNMPSASAKTIKLLEIDFSSENKVHRYEEKAGYTIADQYYPLNSEHSIKGTPLNDVVDLSQHLQSDGSLDWTPPTGTWRVLRLGYSLTGKENHPATHEATGLEVDKFDAAAVTRYINTYLDGYEETLGKDNIGKQGITGLLNDSIEVGASNWTGNILAEFIERRGYDMTPWLPTLTGAIIESSAKTDAFLYDFRQTLADMMVDNHYATITKELHKRGLTHYSEALENGRPTLGDDMAMRRHADIPMAAMWSFDTKEVGPKPQYWSDIRGAASVSHIYGQNLVAAESLTSALAPWAFSPRDLQPMIDMEFALGVNHPIIHSSVHQPITEKAPGLTLFIFGQHFNRLDTWAPYAKPWISYIARNSYMLQQGKFVADVAYFYGEEAPLTALYKDKPPTDIPSEHGFDYINADVILNQLSVDENSSNLTNEHGVNYRAIYLGGTSEYMTLPVLKRLNSLVQQGATVIGKQPKGSPGLMDAPDEFTRIANNLWQGKTGKGKIIVSDNVEQALANLAISSDFKVTQGKADTTIMFVHRKVENSDLYYFTNRKGREEKVNFHFRITGKTPSYWDAQTGKSHPVSYTTEGEHTVIPMDLIAFQSGFIVFDESTNLEQVTIAAPKITTVKQLANTWNVNFEKNLGAPSGIQALTTGDLSQHKNSGIRYFSGTSDYVRTVNIDDEWLQANTKLQVNLGEVGDLAEVFINGKSAGIAWKSPYILDISSLAKPGINRIEVNVTNLWVNRLIGDAQPNVNKVTYTPMDTYRPDAPLRAAGLIGPVTLEWVKYPLLHQKAPSLDE